MTDTPKTYDVAIIGAGLAGLAAAHACEQAGYSCVLLEATDRAGGRIKTDEVEGFLLDHGFQVLLTAYEKANEVLDMPSLRLREFASGAHITADGGNYTITDPLRERGKLLEMAFSGVGSLGDKLRVWRLTQKLKGMGSDEAFNGKEQSTMEYLKEFGFSNKMVEHFFRPFFGGIFLERALDTPAGMFRYVFRYFSLGGAALPENGMQALPQQLLARLRTTEVRYSSAVASLDHDGNVTLKSGAKLHARKVIVACDPRRILPQMDEAIAYRSTVTMYFGGGADTRHMNRLIGLDARKNSAINNYCRHDEIQPHHAPQGRSLWSVSVREGSQATHLHVAEQLAGLIGCKAGDLQHLKTYRIAQALPVVAMPRNDIPAEQTQLGSHIHLAGDYLLNGSIDAALRSGIRAAEAVTETLRLLKQ